MPNEHGKSIDKTYLSVDLAEERGFIHRDYLAHCFRWSHVVKCLYKENAYKTAKILDIGCGREFPLLKTLYSSRLIPLAYTGIDYGPIDPVPSAIQSRIKVTMHQDTSILDVIPSKGWTHLVMFEVLEHMEKEMGIQVLTHIKGFMDNGVILFLSTPNYDRVHKAANHVHEWTYDELDQQLIDLGFNVQDVFGTFASIKDYKSLLNAEQLKIFQRLHEYYDTNVLSIIFAPLFPQQSRNCLWRLTI